MSQNLGEFVLERSLQVGRFEFPSPVALLLVGGGGGRGKDG